MYPTVSGMLTVVAPARITRLSRAHKKSLSLRAASSQLNSTSSTSDLAYSTACTALVMHSSLDIFSLYSKWRSDVAKNVCMRFFGADFIALYAVRMSLSVARAKAHIVIGSFLFSIRGPTVSAMAATLSKSPPLATGNPASQTSTPKNDNCLAILIFSALSSVTPGLCSPSLSVVSNMINRCLVSTPVICFKKTFRNHRCLLKLEGEPRSKQRHLVFKVELQSGEKKVA
eukprot:NODE_683_length_5225_cov_0.594616.p3 type:complete len:229 gc:universal NODE_683_length_5225_cov_0.594616:2270-2956(+)